MPYQDETLTCQDCGAEFIFSAGEQEFYEKNGFQNKPKKCKECRQAAKLARNGGGNRPEKQEYTIVCSECGQEKQVMLSFPPKEDRPVKCDECFRASRA